MSMELVPKVACQKHEISLTFDFLILKMQGNYLHMIFSQTLSEINSPRSCSIYTVTLG